MNGKNKWMRKINKLEYIDKNICGIDKILYNVQIYLCYYTMRRYIFYYNP